MPSQPLQGDIQKGKLLIYCVLKHVQHTALTETRKEIRAGSSNSSLTANTVYVSTMTIEYVGSHLLSTS